MGRLYVRGCGVFDIKGKGLVGGWGLLRFAVYLLMVVGNKGMDENMETTISGLGHRC